MPGTDGYEVARRLRTRFPAGELLPAALSRYGQEQDRQMVEPRPPRPRTPWRPSGSSVAVQEKEEPGPRCSRIPGNKGGRRSDAAEEGR